MVTHSIESESLGSVFRHGSLTEERIDSIERVITVEFNFVTSSNVDEIVENINALVQEYAI